MVEEASLPSPITIADSVGPAGSTPELASAKLE
ncbi:hypothetical protein AK812_SmicGene46120, partial [Symbiodinium microadriaticum]